MKTSLALIFALAAAPALADPACKMDRRAVPDAAIMTPGIVRGAATEEEVLSQTATAVTLARAPLSPKYAKLPRVFVFYKLNGARHGTIAAVLSGPLPQAGDQVVLASRHRDPDSPCAFIPWTVVPGKSGKSTV